MTPEKFQLLNANIDNVTEQELLERLNKGVLVTPNVDHMIRLQKDKEFYNCYENADYVVCDSRILYLLIKLFYPSKALKAQITGSDFFPLFCRHHAAAGNTKVFLLGGSESSIQDAISNINRRSGGEIVVGGYSPPFGFEHSTEETNKIFSLIAESQANVLAVGVGCPKQEKWIQKNRRQLETIDIFMGIGATIEFESGNLKRAPKWMTKFGLEWAYRLAQEPKRLAKRYLLEDIPFFFLFLKQRFGLYKNPWA